MSLLDSSFTERTAAPEEDYRRVYERFYGPVPRGWDVHHKIPRHAGGDNSPGNLVALTRVDHAQAHLKLYQENGDIRDLIAYKMLLGHPLDSDEFYAAAALRGKRTHSLHPEMFREIGRNMGRANLGSFFYNNGARSFIYSSRENHSLPFAAFLEKNPNYSAGRLPSKNPSSAKKGRVLLTDGVKDFWLPLEYRGRLEEFLLINQNVRVGKSNRRSGFRRRTKSEMILGVPKHNRSALK